MRTAQPRFIAKLKRFPRSVRWGVYDQHRASWPVRTPETGRVKQDLRSEEEAQAEADRLNERVSG